MAHMIENNSDFAFTGQRAWHGLGVQIPDAMTVMQALVLGGLDFVVEKRPLFALDSADEAKGLPSIKVPSNFANVRTDNNRVLGIVGARYEIVQNYAALDFFDAAIGEGAAAIETVGALAGGERVFMLAKIPEMVEIVPGDPIERFLLFMNSHDGSSGIQCAFTPIRVVCQNTLSAALNAAKKEHGVDGRAPQRVSIRHTAKAGEKLKKAHEVLSQSSNYFERVTNAYRYMASKKVDKNLVKTFLEKLFPEKVKEGGEVVLSSQAVNNREKVLKAFEESPGAELAGETAWGLFNAATWYIDRQRSLKGDTNRFEASVLSPNGIEMRQNAFDLALAL